MTEAIGEVRKLPKGWVSTTVRESIEIIDYRGRTPPFSESGIPHLRSSNVRNRKIVWEDLRYISEETYQIYMTRGLPEKGDILFTTEAPLGEVALAPEQRFSLAQRIMILRPNKDLLLSKFLLYQIENEDFQRKLRKSGTGTTVTGVSSRNFQPILITLSPINEQSRIVEKIEELFSELDRGIETLRTVQKQLKVYRQAVLKWAFEGKLTEAWRKQRSPLKTGEALLAEIKAERENRYLQQLTEWEEKVREWEAIGKVGKKPTKLQTLKKLSPLSEAELVELAKLPDLWYWVKLGQAFSVFVGSTPSRKEGKYWDGNINWVSSGEVQFCRIHFTKEKITEIGLQNSSTTVHPPGTVILGMIGEGKTRGQAAILNIPASHNQNTAAIRMSETNCYPELLYHYFYYRYQETREIGSGNNQKALNKERVENMAYPLFSIDEQEQIVEEIESRLSICDQLESTIIENLQKAEALRQSILKQAFEGKLVPQDPNDEPAEKLLKRIQAERQERQQPQILKQLTIKGL